MFWRRFCEAAGHPEWIAREADPMPQRSLIKEVEQFIAGLDLEACLALFVAADCCLTPVLSLAEALESEQCLSRRLVRRAPSGALQALFPAWVDGQPPESRAPLLDTIGGFEPAADNDADP